MVKLNWSIAEQLTDVYKKAYGNELPVRFFWYCLVIKVSEKGRILNTETRFGDNH